MPMTGMDEKPMVEAEPITEAVAPEVDGVLAGAVREIELHVAEDGWDKPARLYALVPTADLLTREPGLAAAMGIDRASAAGSLTPVEQDHTPVDRSLEETLERIMWPAEVYGCAAVVERVVLPPEADAQIPEDPDEAEEFAANHPARQEVRIVAGATREGATYCALRFRTHDHADSVVESPDLVPALLELLLSTLEN
jgi:hypothetical protein